MAKKKIKITAPVGAAPFFMALFIGDVVELDEKQAELIVESGRAAYVKSDAAPTAIEITETATSKTSPETATSKPQRKRK